MAKRTRHKKPRANELARAAARVPSFALPCTILVLGVFMLYAGSYHYPLVFDDKVINPVQLPNMARSCLELQTRCLYLSTFGLTYLAVGLDLFWFRLGNVLCHALVSLACFFFFDRLFAAVRHDSPGEAAAGGARARDRLLAFCGAVLFAVHPVSVYGVAYLTQRSIVLATLFSLLSLWALVRAMSGDGRRWLWLSALFYVAALFSKEHSIMLPAVALAIAVLLRKERFGSPRERIVFAVVIAGVGALFVYKLRGLLGAALFEIYTREIASVNDPMIAHIDPATGYLASAVTQTSLFFEYFLLWLIPNPGWMSVDLRQPIARGPLEWPFVLGIPAFLAYGGAAMALLRRRGTHGLLGLGLLFPWFLFFTEFVGARIQETFVLYRSYLWMVGLVATLPFLAQRLSARRIIIAGAVLALVFAAVARERLATFQSQLALWDDAVRKNTDLSLIFVDRGYGNRAVALLREGRLEEALRDLDVTLRLNPRSSHAYVNRAAVLSRQGQEPRALADIERAIKLDPNFAEGHDEKCATLLKMGQLEQALESCNTALRLAPALPTALLNRAILHARAQHMNDALADLDKVLGYESTNEIALYNRGMVYRSLGRAEQATKDLQASCRRGFAPACQPPPP